MASSSGQQPNYKSDKKIDLNIDLDLHNVPIGVFTIDLSTTPLTTMGEIRHELAELLNINPYDLTVTFENTFLEESLIIADFLDDLKEEHPSMYFSLAMRQSVERRVAEFLMTKMIEAKKDKLVKHIIVLEGLNSKHRTELTINEGSLNTYMDLNLT